MDDRLFKEREAYGDCCNEKKIIRIYELKDDGIQIKASQFIGTAKFTNFTLNIIPKIFSKNKPDVWKDIVSCIYFIGDYSTSKIIEYEKITLYQLFLEIFLNFIKFIEYTFDVILVSDSELKIFS